MRLSRFTPMRRWPGQLLVVLAAIASVVYPLAVYFALEHFDPLWVMAPFVLLALARAWIKRSPLWAGVAAGTLVLALLSQNSGELLPMQLYPFLVNVAMLIAFAVSLARPPSAIERMARLREPDLSPAGVAYTRKVTQVWCMFFVVNGSLALGTALWASPQVWALYNGLIAYLLMGLLFVAEWMVRQRVRARAGERAAHHTEPGRAGV